MFNGTSELSHPYINFARASTFVCSSVHDTHYKSRIHTTILAYVMILSHHAFCTLLSLLYLPLQFYTICSAACRIPDTSTQTTHKLLYVFFCQTRDPHSIPYNWFYCILGWKNSIKCGNGGATTENYLLLHGITIEANDTHTQTHTHTRNMCTLWHCLNLINQIQKYINALHCQKPKIVPLTTSWIQWQCYACPVFE